MFSCRAKLRRKSRAPDLYLSPVHIPRIQGQLLNMSSPSMFCSQILAFTVSSKAMLHAALTKNSQTVMQIGPSIHMFHRAVWTHPRGQGGLKEKSKKLDPSVKDSMELPPPLSLQLIYLISSHPSHTTLCIRTVLPPLLRPAFIT